MRYPARCRICPEEQASPTRRGLLVDIAIHFTGEHTGIGGAGLGEVLAFPDYTLPRFVDLLYAVPLGLVGAIAGLLHLVLARGLHKAMAPLARRPIVRGLLGGVVLGLVGAVLPLTLFSGADQIGTVIQRSAELGVAMLLVLAVAKSFVTWLCFSTGYKGGPVFPTIFIGVAVGLVVHGLLPFIPDGVCVLAATAGFAALVVGIPVGISLMLGVFTQPELMPAAAIGAVVAYTFRAAVLPEQAEESPEPTPSPAPPRAPDTVPTDGG